jgi:D-sedoheptulose 7-phosphate isomerase
MSYNNLYLDNFNKGINKVILEIENKSRTPDEFLNSLISETKKVKETSGRLFFFGNGASSSFANHMALDWSKNGKIPARVLSDSSLLTALSNDYSFEESFTEFAKINDLNKNDFVVTISSSGNSPNIVSLLKYAAEIGVKTFALNGLKEDNKSRKIANYSVFYDFKTYGMVECAHQLYLHLWLDAYMDIYEWEKIESQNMNIKNFKL